MTDFLEPTPWDRRNFHVDTYQLTSTTIEALKQTSEVEGHFTVKVAPLENKEKLIKYGFYYVDTLIEPVCRQENLQTVEQEGIYFSRDYNQETILEIAREAFGNGRFHRDFNIPDFMADRRYMNWVKDLIEKDLILALNLQDRTAGFFAYEGDKILLLGIHKDFRGKGFAKAFASHCVEEQFKLTGYDTLKTSISPANLASLNVFISLGFRLKDSVDVYHKLNGSLPVGG
ncbi:GNAT family N-acetyltransferase [Virgibacillus sp. NKC19-3]|uniref:GNAT family N-acetyltransferase n=1 Tax=Virgibacillus saliphilus TaxID=2831674 RepID=UPI001C9A4E9E|nr:GNAT family N-acetyltransferase [Virgibacillus sp. NKC19-3]MBY7144253.1 GNAT family N-acetyltransferase [Virgibacillus sp. NKC19-3]